MWLHFIGKAYYPTPEAFMREARFLGVNRRVSLRALAKFAFGDQIFLAFGDFLTKARTTPPKDSFAFGFFIVTKIGGLPADLLQKLPRDAYEKTAPEGRKVSRGCGQYFISDLVSGIRWTLGELAEFLQSEFPNAKPTLGGIFQEIPPTKLQRRFHWGYSRLLPGTDDWEALRPYMCVRANHANEQLWAAELITDYQLRFWDSTGPSSKKVKEVSDAAQPNAPSA